MLLFLKVIDNSGEPRHFSCLLDTLEKAFNFLDRVVANGDTLTQASIIDDDQQINLPLDAFDGQSSFLTAIQSLENEWRSILSDSGPSASVASTELVGLIQRRVRYYTTKIANHNLMIGRLNLLLNRTRECIWLEPGRSRSIQRYELLINRNQLELVKVQVYQKLITDRLSRLAI